MKKSMTIKKYKHAVDMISHLILTKPQAVIKLLSQHGVVFSPPPKKGQLINEVVELMGKGSSSFNHNLSQLLEIHIKNNPDELLSLNQGSHNDADEDELFGLGGIIGGVAKGLVGGVSKLLGKKKKHPKPSGPAPTTVVAASGGGAKAALQATQLKFDMQMKMQQMQAEQRRREAEFRRQREEADRRRRREEEDHRRRKQELENAKKAMAKKPSLQTAGMGSWVGIGLVVLIGGGLLIREMNKGKAPA